MKTTAYALQLEEIIFSTRNREYGAYILRAVYSRNLTWSYVIVSILFVSSLLLPQYLIKGETSKSSHGGYTGCTLNLITLPAEKFITQKPVVYTPKTSSIRYTVPVVTDDENVATEYMPTVDELDNVNPGLITAQGSPDGTDIITDNNSGTPEIVTEPAPDKPFTWAEEMPAFPGGDQALRNFLYSNIVYPELAQKAGVEGKVIISFTVNIDGSITDYLVLKGIGAGCDEEALRVIQKIEKMNPGKQNGKPVRINMKLPILFRLKTTSG